MSPSPARLLPCLAALAVSLTGCAGDSVALEVSWLLGDGQSCFQAGVSQVFVEIESSGTAIATFECEAGFAPSKVGLGDYEPGIVELRVTALTPQGEVRYEASGRLDLRDDAVLAPMQLDPVEE